MMQEVSQAVEDTVRDVLNSNVHTSMPGRIIEIDREKRLLKVQPIGSFYVDGEEFEYPIISGVPASMIYGEENIAVCVPLKVEDTCTLMFAEQSISAWVTDTSESQSDERFELTNCVAIPGLRKKWPDAQDEAIEKECLVVHVGEDTRIYVKKDGIEVKVKGGNVTLEVEEGAIQMQSTQSINLSATENITLTAPEIILNGQVSIAGDLGVSGHYPGGW